MVSCFAEACSKLVSQCVNTNLGYTLLGEAHGRLVEDDVEGLTTVLAKGAGEKRGIMLVFACVHGASRCATYLVKQGALQDVNMAACGEPLQCFTPITVAALLGHWEVVDALLEGGVKAHAFDGSGFSALLVAAHRYPGGNLESLLKLEGTYLYTNISNSKGLTPLIVASASAVPLLVEAGADLNLAGRTMGRPLLRACGAPCLEKVKALVDCGADETIADFFGMAPLMTAAEKGHADIVEYLLGRPGIDINAKTFMVEESALDYACKAGHLEVVKLLVAAGARVGSQEKKTALMGAAQNGHIDVVEYLLGRPGVEIDAKGKAGAGALDLACGGGHLEVVKLLVAAGATVNPQAISGWGALGKAASGGHVEVLKYLVEEEGADVGRAGSNGMTPLLLAAQTSEVGSIAYLLGRPGTDIRGKSDEGYTALELACTSCFLRPSTKHLEAVKLLVAAGAKVGYRVSDGAEHGRMPMVVLAAYGGSLEVVKYLVEEYGADERLVCSDGETALTAAAEVGRVGIVEYLLGRPGVDISAKTANGEGPLDLACAKGHLEVVKLLVAAGAAVNPQAKDEGGPLISAATRGHLEVVQYLVEEAGADVCAVRSNGKGPLWWACQSDHTDTVAYLVQRQREALKPAEERAAAAAAALLEEEEEEERAAAAKRASKKKKKAKKKAASRVPPHMAPPPPPDQAPSSSVEPYQNPSDSQTMAELDLGHETTGTEGGQREEGQRSDLASLAPAVLERITSAPAEGGPPDGPHGHPGNSDEVAPSVVVHDHTTPPEDEEEGKPMMVMPDELSCPISFQLMTDAVMADDGHTYQEQAIQEWINKCTAEGRPVTSPLTGAEMGSTLRPNLFVRSLVRGYDRRGCVKG